MTTIPAGITRENAANTKSQQAAADTARDNPELGKDEPAASCKGAALASTNRDPFCCLRRVSTVVVGAVVPLYFSAASTGRIRPCDYGDRERKINEWSAIAYRACVRVRDGFHRHDRPEKISIISRPAQIHGDRRS